MQLLYDRNANEDAMISGQFPNSTANFTIETINGNEHSNTPGGSVATDVVRSIEHGDYSSQKTHDQMRQLQAAQHKRNQIQQIQQNSSKIQINQNLNNLNMLAQSSQNKKGNNVIRSQLQHLMKNSNTTLERLLKDQNPGLDAIDINIPVRNHKGSVNRSYSTSCSKSQNQILDTYAQTYENHGQRSKSANIFDDVPFGRINYKMTSQNLLPSKLVDQQKIETPMQYKMAVKVQKTVKNHENKRNLQMKKHVDRLKHTRFGKSQDFQSQKQKKLQSNRRRLPNNGKGASYHSKKSSGARSITPLRTQTINHMRQEATNINQYQSHAPLRGGFTSNDILPVQATQSYQSNTGPSASCVNLIPNADFQSSQYNHQQNSLVSNPFIQSQNNSRADIPGQNLDSSAVNEISIQNQIPVGYDFSLSQDINQRYATVYGGNDHRPNLVQPNESHQKTQNRQNYSKTSEGPFESIYMSQKHQSNGEQPNESVNSYVDTTQSIDQNGQSKSQSQMVSQSLLALMAQAGNSNNHQYGDQISQAMTTQYSQTLPHPPSLGGTANTSQLQMGPKVQHLASKYNVELNPGNQHIFDEKDKLQASMITSRQTISVKTGGTAHQSQARGNARTGPASSKPKSKAKRQIRSSRSQMSYGFKKSDRASKQISQDANKSDGRSRSRNRQWHGRKQTGVKTSTLHNNQQKETFGSIQYVQPQMESNLTNVNISANKTSRSKSKENSVQRSIRAFIGLGATSHTHGGNSIRNVNTNGTDLHRLESTGQTSVGIDQQIHNATMNYSKSKTKGMTTMNTTAGRDQSNFNTHLNSKTNNSLKHLEAESEKKNCIGKSQTSLFTALSQKTVKSTGTMRNSKQSQKKTRSNSRKASSGKHSNQGQSRVKRSLNKLVKMQNMDRADKFYRELMVRRHFCIWIESYIDRLKLQRTASNDDIRPKSVLITKSFNASSRSKSRHSARSNNSRKSGLSGFSNSKYKATKFAGTNEQILFKDASKSSVPISQGFFDNVASPNSYCAFPQLGNIATKDPTTEPSVMYNHTSQGGQYIITRDGSNLLDQSQTTSLNLQMNPSIHSKSNNLNTSGNIKLKSNIQNMHTGAKQSSKGSWRDKRNEPREFVTQAQSNLKESQINQNQMNHESMQNIISKQSQDFYNHMVNPNVNCFARNDHSKLQNPSLLCSEDLQTRNVSTISGKAEFRETAQLGSKIGKIADHQQEMNMFDHQAVQNTLSNNSVSASDLQNNFRSNLRFSKGLNILRKIDNKVLNRYLGDKTKVSSSIIKRTSRSNSKSRTSKSKSVSRSRSRSNRPVNKKTKPIKNSTLNESNLPQGSSKSNTISSWGPKNQQTKPSYMQTNQSKSKFSSSGASMSRAYSKGISVERSISEKKSKYVRTLGHQTLQESRSRSRSRSQRSASRSVSRSAKSFTKSGLTSIDGQSTITRRDVVRLLKQKHFLKWQQFLNDEKAYQKRSQKLRLDKSISKRIPHSNEYHDKIWLRTYRANALKAKVFTNLLQFTLQQKRLNDIGYAIMSQNRTNVISQTFLIWIEQFNTKSLERKKLFFASCHWVNKTLQKFFRNWSHISKIQIHHRYRIRQAVPMRCLLRMISQNSRVVPPQVLENNDIGQELFYSSQFYAMNRINQQYMFDAIEQFKCNLVKEIFNKLKNNYYNICRFKGNLAINKATQIVHAWFNYSNTKVQNRKKCENFHCTMVINKYKKMLNSWSNIVKYKKFLRDNEQYFKVNKLHRGKYMIFEAIRQHACLQNEKSLMKYRAQKMEERRVLNMCLRQIHSYMCYRQQKNARSSEIQANFQRKLKTNVLNKMAAMCKKLSDLDAKKKLVLKNHLKFVKLDTLRSWHITSLHVGRARVHHNLNSTKFYFHLLREAVILSQISGQKKLKAHSFRSKNLKYDLLWFLKEYQNEQERKRALRIENHNLIQDLRLRNIFTGFKNWVSNKQKQRAVDYELQRNRDHQIRIHVFNALKMNIEWQFRIYEFEHHQTLKFKKLSFDYLRYSARKQSILRHALIETVTNRNKKKAALILDIWKDRAIYEQHFKQQITTRERHFKLLRAVRKFSKNRDFNMKMREIKQMSYNQRYLRLKQYAWTGFYQRHTSKKVKDIKIAFAYRRKQLISPAFKSLKKLSVLKKLLSEARQETEMKNLKNIMNLWIQTVQQKQLSSQTQTHFTSKILKKAFECLKHNRYLQQERANFMDIAKQHFSITMKRKSFLQIKNYGPMMRQNASRKIAINQAMQTHFTKVILQRWRKVTRSRKLNASHFIQVQNKRSRIVEKIYFKQMKSLLMQRQNMRRATSKHYHLLQKRVFIYLKKQGTRNKILKTILGNHSSQKKNELIKTIFGVLKKTRLESKKFKQDESKALQQLAKFLMVKVFNILQINANQKRRLKGIHDQVQRLTEEKLMKRCVKEIVGTYVIQPKLDAIGHQFFMRKQLQTFKKKVYYIKSRNEGTNLHDFEIKAFEALGKNLMRKAFTGLKLHTQCRILKNQEHQMIIEYQHRKWFNIWRSNYMLKAQNNYFMPVIQQQQNMNLQATFTETQLQTSGNISGPIGGAPIQIMKSDRSLLPPRYVQNFNSNQNKERSNDLNDREAPCFSPETYTDHTRSREQQPIQHVEEYDGSKSKDGSRSTSIQHPRTVSNNRRSREHMPPRNRESSAGIIQESHVEGQNLRSRHQNLGSKNFKEDRQNIHTEGNQVSRTANFQSKRGSQYTVLSEQDQFSGSKINEKQYSMAEKAQMLSEKIQSRIAHSRDSRGVTSGGVSQESKSRSRSRSQIQSGIASIRQGTINQTSMVNSPNSPQSIENKDYNTFGHQQRPVQHIEAFNYENYDNQGHQILTHMVVGQEQSPQRFDQAIGSQLSQSNGRSPGKSQPRQRNLQQSSPKKRFNDSVDQSTEIKLHNEINQLVTNQKFEMHEITDQLRDVLANSGHNYTGFGREVSQENYYNYEAKGGSESKSRSFKNFLNKKNKVNHILDSGHKSANTNSAGKSGESDPLKLSNMSPNEHEYLPHQLYGE